MLDIPLNVGERFLCEALCRRERLDQVLLAALYAQLGDAAAFALCEHNKVSAIAADALLQCRDLTIPPHWMQARQAVAARIEEYMRELDKAAALLAAESIPMVALKNSGIARALYLHWGASPMGDLDVLVRPSDFRRAHAVLSAHGYRMKFRSPLEEENFELAERGGGTEYAVQLASGQTLWFELQWRPVAGRWIRPDQEPGADALMARSVAVAGSAVRLLAPEDNLLQVALHTAKHTYVRAPGFRLHTDVDRIVGSVEIDWDRFCAMVCTLQVKTAVFFSLALAQQLLHTPVPAPVLAALAPPRWKICLMTRWLRRVGLFDPDGRKWGSVGYIVFVALLYDDLRGLWRGVFPDRQQMAQRHGLRPGDALWLRHVQRIVQMVRRRTLVK